MIREGLRVSILAYAILWVGCTADEGAAERVKVVLSEPYEIDRLYASMAGPQSMTTIRLLDAPDPELLWVTGYRAVITDTDGETLKSQQYMCHSTLRPTLPVDKFVELTLAQGQLDLDLPDGFAIPVMSNVSFNLYTQVLNMHQPTGVEHIRQKVSVEFVRNAELDTPPVPLEVHYAYVMVALEGEPAVYGVSSSRVTEEQQAATCLPGQNAEPHRGAHSNVHRDSLGREFSGHFLVPPGRHVYRTLATGLMNLTYDTTVHYVAAHLHPYSESLELRDLTTDETVYKAYAYNFVGEIGLEAVDHYSSTTGLKLFRDHQYEIVAVYDNTTDDNQDAMAVLFMYTQDKKFSQTL